LQASIREDSKESDSSSVSFSSSFSSLLEEQSLEILSGLLGAAVSAILVKGDPGTGKTTLALELLGLHKKGIYISTRVSMEQIIKQNPHTSRLMKEGNLIEVNTEDIQQKKLLLAKEKATTKFEDLRLATATDVIETVVNAVTKVSEPLIVLDSWDAVAKQIDPIERLKVEKSLLLISSSRKAKLVFISEEPQLTTTDYLVDAVVILRRDFLEGRRIRKIEFSKLRGSAIPQSTYLYTLDHGRMSLFAGPQVLSPVGGYEAKPFKPMPHHGEFYSTGSPDLDAFLHGGLKQGSITILELGKYVGTDWHFPLTTSVYCNFLANGGACVSLPGGGVTPDMVVKVVESFFPNKVVDSSFRIASLTEDDGHHSFMLDRTSASDAFEMFYEEVRKINDNGKRPCVELVGVDALESVFSPEDLVKAMIPEAQYVKQFGSAKLNIVRSGTRSKQVMSDRCDLHLKMDEIDGSLVLYSVKPPSQFYGVCYDYSLGRPLVRLTPIV
jgi:KaiC/GvpD/RAD55 family RecA-like ATPase